MADGSRASEIFRQVQKLEILTVLTPETEMVVSVISVGYIKENPPKPKRKDVDDILKGEYPKVCVNLQTDVR